MKALHIKVRSNINRQEHCIAFNSYFAEILSVVTWPLALGLMSAVWFGFDGCSSGDCNKLCKNSHTCKVCNDVITLSHNNTCWLGSLQKELWAAHIELIDGTVCGMGD